MKRRTLASVVLIALLGVQFGTRAADSKSQLHMVAGGPEYLALEPILVTVQATGVNLPPGPGKRLRFEITPPVKPRSGAKPLPLEGRVESASRRTYDLMEWFQFPPNAAFTVRAVFQNGDSSLTSETISLVLHRPDPKHPEAGPVDRLHHLPWSNYVTNAFCGDTFDLVKRWPESKLAQYCHYYNGLHHQHKKEYDKAEASFRTVLAKYPDFVLADAAQFGIAECLFAQKKVEEAAGCLLKQRQKLGQRQDAIHLLNQRLTGQLLERNLERFGNKK